MALRPTTISRLAARSTARPLQRLHGQRGLSSTPTPWAASSFLMPALSPTMTEGNIASWKIKEGDSFAPGDVLLEIETDKAQMDVEAQEEGVLAKIVQHDGTKSVPVGSRIAVLAEEGDDLANLELPPEPEQGKTPAASASSSTSASQPSAPNPSQEKAPSSLPSAASSDGTPQKYPLYPSVQMLLHQQGIPLEDANKIPATGPQGRLLKGDVLAHLGQIKQSLPQQLASSISKLERLDLSNIQVAPVKSAPKAKTEEIPTPAAKETEPNTEVVLPISLQAVFETRDRIQTSLGVEIPLSTFIARASDIANDGLPRGNKPLSANELFDAVLGLDAIPKTAPGNFFPLVTSPVASTRLAPLTKPLDIIDVLTANPKKHSRAMAHLPSTSTITTPTSGIFSLLVSKGDAQRAQIYLERLKAILEVEPGRLIL